jgi:hypothetical protein
MQASKLEDFVDEEVVDNRGRSTGVLSCYWESASGHVFLGVKLKQEETVHVVPANGGELDEPHSCVKLGFSRDLVRTAPIFDCDNELRPKLEEAANEHFGELTSDA